MAEMVGRSTVVGWGAAPKMWEMCRRPFSRPFIFVDILGTVSLRQGGWGR